MVLDVPLSVQQYTIYFGLHTLNVQCSEEQCLKQGYDGVLMTSGLVAGSQSSLHTGQIAFNATPQKYQPLMCFLIFDVELHHRTGITTGKKKQRNPSISACMCVFLPEGMMPLSLTFLSLFLLHLLWEQAQHCFFLCDKYCIKEPVYEQPWLYTVDFSTFLSHVVTPRQLVYLWHPLSLFYFCARWCEKLDILAGHNWWVLCIWHLLH